MTAKKALLAQSPKEKKLPLGCEIEFVKPHTNSIDESQHYSTRTACYKLKGRSIQKAITICEYAGFA